MYSPKVQNNACVDNRDTTSNVIPLFCYDAIFGSMRILEFPKGSDYLYAHKAVNYFFMIKSIESYYFTKGTLREECFVMMPYLGVCVYWNSPKVRITCMHIRLSTISL
jgi:hypothetical protein